MAFKFNKKSNSSYHKANKAKQFAPHKPALPKTTAKDLVDPVLYVGDLDQERYPRLEQKQDDKNTQEVENPLNQRR